MASLGPETPSQEMFFEEVVGNREIPPQAVRPEMLIELLNEPVGTTSHVRPGLVKFLEMFTTHPQASYKGEYEGHWADPGVSARFQAEVKTVYANNRLPRGIHHYYALARAHLPGQEATAYKIAWYAMNIGNKVGWPSQLKVESRINLHPFMKLMAHHANEILRWTEKPNPVTADWCAKETFLGHGLAIHGDNLHYASNRLSELVANRGMTQASANVPLSQHEVLFGRGQANRDIDLFEKLFVRLNVRDRKQIARTLGLIDELSDREYQLILKHMQTYDLVFLGLLQDVPTPAPEWNGLETAIASFTGRQRPNDTQGQLEVFIQQNATRAGLDSPQLLARFLFDQAYDKRRNLDYYHRLRSTSNGWSSESLSHAISAIQQMLDRNPNQRGLGGAAALITLLSRAENRVAVNPQERHQLPTFAKQLRQFMAAAVNDIYSVTAEARAAISIKSEAQPLSFNGLIEPNPETLNLILKEGKKKLTSVEAEGTFTLFDKIDFRPLMGQRFTHREALTQNPLSVEADRFRQLFIENDGSRARLQELFSIEHLDEDKADNIRHKLRLSEILMLTMVKGRDVATPAPLPLHDFVSNPTSPIGTGSYAKFLEGLGGPKTLQALQTFAEAIVAEDGVSHMETISPAGESSRDIINGVIDALTKGSQSFDARGIATKIYKIYSSLGEVIHTGGSLRENEQEIFDNLHRLMNLCVTVIDNPTIGKELGLNKLVPKV